MAMAAHTSRECEAGEEGEWIERSGEMSMMRRNLLGRYLSIKREEAYPVLSEYFGVALAFTALGSLIRRVNDRKKALVQGPVVVKRRVQQRVALNSLVKRAMERLHEIAAKAQELQDKLKERNDVGYVEVEAELRRRVAEAEVEVSEMRKRRDEDAKANEKVMAMFATQEQHWTRERKRLKGEAANLRKELTDCLARVESRAGVGGSCLECKKKDLLVLELQNEVKEQEFLVAAASEASSIEQSDRCELAGKLSDAELAVERLKAELAAETESRRKGSARLENLELELEDAKREASDGIQARVEFEKQKSVLVKQRKQLEEEVKDQERVIGTLVGRIECLKAENSELSEKIDGSRSVGSSEPFGDGHAEQQRELHAMYMDQVTELENQVAYYQERVLRLEESALIRLDRYNTGNCGNLSHGDVEEMLVNLSADVDKDLQLRAAKTLLVHYMDAERARELELGKWRKLYSASKIALNMVQNGNDSKQSMKQQIEAAKAQQAAELAERHWYEIDSFERLMKAKDERMEALRVHLLSLEKQVKNASSELNDLRSSLDAETALRADAEARLSDTQHKLKFCCEKLEESNSNVAIKRVKRSQQESDVTEVLQRKEAEIHGKDLRLAFVEAKLVQVQMQYENERKLRESLLTEVLKEKQVLEDLAKDSLEGGQDLSLKNAIATACFEVEKLSGKIAEAREQIMNASTSPSEEAGKLLKKIEGPLLEPPTSDRKNTKSSTMVVRNERRLNPSSGVTDNAFVPILMKEQLQRYHRLLQKINELSIDVESGSKNGTLLNTVLQRALELQNEVNSLGGKLQLIASGEDPGSLQGPRLLNEHLSQIQKRLELKVGNMVNELRKRPGIIFQRPRLRRSHTTGSSEIAAQLVMQNHAQPAELHR